ncbi:MAG: branched-chain amino acid ABC transporter permease [archaeon]|nr:branched-chain amino acid ABC transporter permease [archaeon]
MQTKMRWDRKTLSLAQLKKIGLFTTRHSISPAIVLVGLMLTGIYPIVSGASPASLFEYTPYFMWIALAVSWNICGGYAGLLNLGLVGFFALGAFVTGFAMSNGLTVGPALIMAGAIGGLLGLVLVPAFRLRSDYFAIGTLVVPFMLKPMVEALLPRSNFSIQRGELLSSIQLYYLGLAIAAISIFGTYLIMRTRIGLALRAIGDQENASASLGINTLFYKTIALVLSGFIAAVAGGYFLQHISIDSTLFENLNYSLFPIFMVIIGGIGTFEGPIIGAVLFSVVTYELNGIFPGTSYAVLLFSVVIMFVAVAVPRGIVPWIRGRLHSV